jgi:hypothetical protein
MTDAPNKRHAENDGHQPRQRHTSKSHHPAPQITGVQSFLAGADTLNQ